MLVSVITVCLNVQDSIVSTVKSVLGQTYPEIEYLIIDGGSTDGTLKLIKHLKKGITKIVSEKDRGLYDAMNKGLSLAKGDIVIFINSGDRFYRNDVVSKIISLWPEGTDLVYGDVYLDEEKKFKIQSNIGTPFLMYDNICHQSIFVKKECFKIVGNFDIKYKVAADFEWLLRGLKRNKLEMKHVDVVISCYQGGGKSSNKIIFRSEHREILNKYFNFLEITYNKLVFKFTDYVKHRK